MRRCTAAAGAAISPSNSSANDLGGFGGGGADAGEEERAEQSDRHSGGGRDGGVEGGEQQRPSDHQQERGQPSGDEGCWGYVAAVGGRVVTARRTGGRAWPDALAHPASVCLLAWLTARSVAGARTGRLTWRGRPVDVGGGAARCGRTG